MKAKKIKPFKLLDPNLKRILNEPPLSDRVPAKLNLPPVKNKNGK